MQPTFDVKTFQGLIAALNHYWANQGCVIMQPVDMEVGAGTFHTGSFLGAIGPEPWRAAYVQPSRRPTDGRYGENPNRVQRHHQYQVVLKPSPLDIQALYLGSLRALGIDTTVQDIRFVEDNWESPTLGAWGLGWEVWLNGMEVTQFTYFQQVGGLECKPVTGEITYGLERLAMSIQNVDNIYDLVWSKGPQGTVTYGDVYHQTEVEMSKYNFEVADVATLFKHFEFYETESLRLIEAGLPLPAYEMVLKASHTFNLLDARHALSVTERQHHILKIRRLSKAVAESYYQSREALGFPLLKDGVDKAESSRQAMQPEVMLPALAQDCLVEILTEELPPKSLRKLSAVFRQEVEDRLRKAGVAFKSVEAYATPRRLAVMIKKLASATPDQIVERKGPAKNAAFDANGNPTPACVGFAKSCGVTADQLQVSKTAQGEWMTYPQKVAGKSVNALMPNLIEQAALALPIPKRMRWGDRETQFVRPVHAVTILFGDQVMSGEVLGCSIDQLTVGHRFHTTKPIVIKRASGYEKTMATKGHVIIDFARRRDQILALAEQCVRDRLGDDARVYISSDAFLDEVTGLVEKPVALCGQFDQAFLSLPSEVLISSMQDHQRYFPVKDKQGKLLPYFITMSNIDSRDPGQVIHGNERVIRARLADAAFFFAADQKDKLASRLDRLKGIVNQAKLGSLYDKSERMSRLAEKMAVLIGDAVNKEDAMRAALLAKADLTTHMVNEFPELQGMMGGYYAAHDNESHAVAEAISQHYQPRFAGDVLPVTTAGQIVSLADRIDTLVGAFGINQIPTGDKDPYGLRRSALGVLRILIEKRIHLNLEDVLSFAVSTYASPLENKEVVRQLLSFMQERLRAWYQEQGVSADVFASVASLNLTDPLDVDERIKAVQAFKKLNEAETLSVANKRVSNILSKYVDAIDAKSINPDIFETAAEAELARQLEAKSEKVVRLYQEGKYDQALLELADLRKPIDDFFEQVMVMTEDKPRRENRLLLLSKLRALFSQVADIALLQ